MLGGSGNTRDSKPVGCRAGARTADPFGIRAAVAGSRRERPMTGGIRVTTGTAARFGSGERKDDSRTTVGCERGERERFTVASEEVHDLAHGSLVTVFRLGKMATEVRRVPDLEILVHADEDDFLIVDQVDVFAELAGNEDV